VAITSAGGAWTSSWKLNLGTLHRLGLIAMTPSQDDGA
jgi:hypothetical protein